MVYDYNPNILEAEKVGLRVQSQPDSYTETVFRNNKNSQAALYYVTKTKQQTPSQTHKQLPNPS